MCNFADRCERDNCMFKHKKVDDTSEDQDDEIEDDDDNEVEGDDEMNNKEVEN